MRPKDSGLAGLLSRVFFVEEEAWWAMDLPLGATVNLPRSDNDHVTSCAARSFTPAPCRTPALQAEIFGEADRLMTSVTSGE